MTPMLLSRGYRIPTDKLKLAARARASTPERAPTRHSDHASTNAGGEDE
jgi:hypothetical protein